MSRKNIFIIIGATLLLLVIVVAGIMSTQKNTVPGANPLSGVDKLPDQQDQQDSPDAAEPTPQETEHTDVHAEFTDLNLGNLEVLQSVYDEKAYLFIDQETLNYASTNFGNYSGFTIDTTSFSKRDASSYQFMVRDSNDNRLFYAIATRLPSGQILMEFYNI